MQETIRRYSDNVRRAHDFEVQIRVGLNSGEVVVRAVGSDLCMDYTAVGKDEASGRPDGSAGPPWHDPEERHEMTPQGMTLLLYMSLSYLGLWPTFQGRQYS
jgi:hypothetical protein